MTVCLVTGGAGFIGSHLVEALMARGDRVRVLDNLSSGRLGNLPSAIKQIEFLEGDVRDETMVQQATAGVDYVFHLAAMVSVPQSMARPLEAELINTVGTLNVLQAAQNAGVHRVVLSSTCAVYGDEPTLPKTEAMPPQPQSPYAISKLAAESYCRVFNKSTRLQAVVLRYFNVFGPRQDPASPYSGVISIFIDKMLQGVAPTIYGDGEQTRDFVFVGDVVRANLLAAATKQAAGQVFNIGTGCQTTINQLFNQLCRLLKCNFDPVYAQPRPGDVVHSYADPSRAGDILGWQAGVDLAEGLRQLVAAGP